MPRDAEQLRNIISLDSELNKIQDVDILLERILYEARSVVNADAGSIYTVSEGELVISYAQNDTQQRQLPPGQKLIYPIFTVPINTKSQSGYVASTGQLLNVPDVYEIPESAPYGYDPVYDRASGYRSTSMLTVPLKTGSGDILGVIQVINRMTDDGTVVAFDTDDELLVTHFATNATVALQRAQMTRAILLRMIQMTELRDPRETGPHVNRVAGYAVELYEAWATRVGFPRKQIERTRDNLRMAAMLHDAGKVAISDTILKKPARLTEDEYATMKSHTWQGARLFRNKQSEFDEMAQIVALNHHERWDGTGYPGHVDPDTGEAIDPNPDGTPRPKSGHEIPFFGRIVAIADVYDALVSRRTYKEAWSEEDAIGEIREQAGRQFDPELVDIFLDIQPSIRTVSQRYDQ